jgi:hypothetical protein
MTGRPKSFSIAAIRLENSSGQLAFASTQSDEIITGINDWQTSELILYDIPQGVTIINVYLVLLHNTSGIVYFDDIELTIID